MSRYWMIGYFLNKEIQFYRTTSIHKLNNKINELKASGAIYNTLTVKGFDLSFK